MHIETAFNDPDTQKIIKTFKKILLKEDICAAKIANLCAVLVVIFADFCILCNFVLRCRIFPWIIPWIAKKIKVLSDSSNLREQYNKSYTH